MLELLVRVRVRVVWVCLWVGAGAGTTGTPCWIQWRVFVHMRILECFPVDFVLCLCLLHLRRTSEGAT